MDKKAMNTLIAWLEQKAESIHRIESKAHTALHETGDSQIYRQLMEEKATLLATLAEESSPLTEKVKPPKQGVIKETLSRFSSSASSALKIGSVFYMSALLYPEEHESGTPNDLEEFISKLRSFIA